MAGSIVAACTVAVASFMMLYDTGQSLHVNNLSMMT
jgi:hypothetical protein